MAIKTGAKIIPIGIRGEAKPFHQTTIVYGKPIDFSQKVLDAGEKDVVDEATEELKEAIVKLSKEA